MKTIDLHCDTIWKLTDNKEESLKKNSFSIDTEKLIKGKYLAQFFAVFVDISEYSKPFDRAKRMISCFYEQLNANDEFLKLALSYSELLENRKMNKISCFLSIEEGAVLNGLLENLRYFYDSGVRMMTLTWNYPNEIGYPNYEWKHSQKGLKSFGKQVVEEMNSLGMIVDVSHLSDGGFYDVAEISKLPFIASHSNARTVTNHPRNLSDDMIRLIAEKGGVMGLNFCSLFLGESETSRLEDMLTHIIHIRNIGGIDVISLGSDFDGIVNEVEIKNCSEIMKLADMLQKAGFNENDIDKIFYKNATRIIKDIMN
jgi:Zn-dependent dipeptidase, microsomal dipeptidase homolog